VWACDNTDFNTEWQQVEARYALSIQPALVNGTVGAVWASRGRPRVVFGFTIMRGKIVEIDLVADPGRLRELDLAVLND
jgi:hypothetical protein